METFILEFDLLPPCSFNLICLNISGFKIMLLVWTNYFPLLMDPLGNSDFKWEWTILRRSSWCFSFVLYIIRFWRKHWFDKVLRLNQKQIQKLFQSLQNMFLTRQMREKVNKLYWLLYFYIISLNVTELSSTKDKIAGNPGAVFF